MSLTPSGFNNLPSATGKSFWARPEGRAGMVVLAGLGIAVGLALFNIVLPFLIGIVWGTVQLVVGAVTLFLLIMLLTNKTVHRLVGLSFRLIMRFLTGIIFQLDPIGILKDRLKEMNKRSAQFVEQITNLKGAINNLQSIIQKNTQEAAQEAAMAKQAQANAVTYSDPDEQTNMRIKAEQLARSSQRKVKANQAYTEILGKLTKMYGFLTRLKRNIDFYIADTTDEVKQQEIQYKTINTASRAYKTALSILKGDAEESDLYNSTMEFLAEDASRKLGEIEEIQKSLQDVMDTMDLKNSVISDEAIKALEVHEQKMLAPDSIGTYKQPIPQREEVPVLRNNSNDDYNKLLS